MKIKSKKVTKIATAKKNIEIFVEKGLIRLELWPFEDPFTRNSIIWPGDSRVVNTHVKYRIHAIQDSVYKIK